MQLALECPTAYLSDLIPLSDFNFLLAHLVLKDKRYRDYYSQRSSAYTILDNSVNELGQPCTLKEMQVAANLVGVQKIIPPDYLGDWEKTIRSLTEAIELWGHSIIIPVVQGSSLEEVLKCGRILIDELGFKTIAVPFDTTLDRNHTLEQLAEGRRQAILGLLFINRDIKIHLLGFTTFEEIDDYKIYSDTIVSLDTGSPYTNAVNSRRFGCSDLLPKKGYSIDYNTNYEDEDFLTTLYNLAYMRKRFNSVGKGIED